VCDHPSLEKWLQKELPRQPNVLYMPRELLLRREGDEPVIAQFPDALEWDGLRVPLVYRYEPGHPADGVTAVLPLALLERLPEHLPEWLVPGLLRDKLIALLKALPKQYRKTLVPVPDTADMLLAAIRPCDRPLAEVVAEVLRERLRLSVPREAWAEDALDAFYRMNLRLVAADGTIVAEGRERTALRARWIRQSRGEVQRAAPAKLSREGIVAWDFGALPSHVTVKGAGLDVPAYPVLRDRGETVAIETLTDQHAAAETHRAGVRRMLLLADKQGSAWLRRNLLRDARAVLALGQRIEHAALLEDLLLAAAGDCLPDDAQLPRDEASFAVLAASVKAQIGARAQQLEGLLAHVSRELQRVNSRRGLIDKPPFAAARADIEAQLARLLAPGFLVATPPQWRERLPVYLAAIALRMERIGQRLARDQECTRELAALQARLDAGHSRGKAAAEEYRWMLEEYRVSLFAQQLGTRGAVSRKRLDKLWESVLL
jgi:ATP-dependent helicase HrpA